MGDFHTPQLPAPLNLDLANLGGGGFAPSQFFGKTHRGHDVYVRYRGGSLSVRIAQDLEEDAVNAPPVLNADIGPAFDGALSLHQFCRAFGVTVNGAIPEETDANAHRYSDLSGRTTYWRCDRQGISEPTSRNLLMACQAALTKALLVQPVTDDKFRLQRLQRLQQVAASGVSAATVWLVQGPVGLDQIATDPAEYVLPQEGQLQVAIHYSAWQFPPLPMQVGLLDQACADLGRNLVIPTGRDDQGHAVLATDNFQLKAEFPSDDVQARKLLSALGDAVAARVPVTTLERVALGTGDVVDTLQRPLDPVIAAWTQAGEDRWISVLRDTRDGPWIGVRPARD